MKKQLLCILLCFIPNFIFSQNWSIINSVEKFNYRLDDDKVISATIWTDSAKANGSDSVFFLNRIICDSCLTWVGGPDSGCVSCYGAKNEPQFLQRKCFVSSSGEINLVDTGNIVINTHALLNDSWLFDSTQNISATVISITTGSVFGNSDSLKTIVLSSGDTLILSRSYGLLQYPNGYNHNSYYRLTGIEGSGLGEYEPKFADFFNINVGDMFEYYDWGENGLDGNGYANRKYVITTKQINGDTITFHMSGLKRTVDTYPDHNVFYSVINNNLVAIDSINHFTNLYNHQQFIIPDYTFVSVYGFGEFSVDSNNLATKELNTLDFNIPYSYPIMSDTLLRVHEAGRSYQIYTVGLGQTSWYSTDNFEHFDGSYLVAYRKGRDTVGVFTADSMLTGMNEFSSVKNNLRIFPNPTLHFINIYLDKSINQGKLNIYNIMGAKVYSEIFNGRQKTLDLNFSSGIYFLQLSDGQERWTEKIIVE